MVSDNGNGRSPLRTLLLVLLIVVLPLAIGLFVAPRLVPKPQIGIIRLSVDITAESAFIITEQLAFARNDDAIQAVVVVLNSPGGSAAYSEELYLDVLNTRDQMPVIASVDLLAASGAYYLAAGADEIYAKPTSIIGSIGVIATLQDDTVFLEEDVLTTGPYKSFGGTRDGTIRQMERAKFSFLEAVIAARGERLSVSPDFISRAEVYTGIDALDFGLIDGLLAGDEAIQRAAELAGLANYDVVELFPLTFDTDSTFVSYEPPEIDVEKLWAIPEDLAPGVYYRYIPAPAN